MVGLGQWNEIKLKSSSVIQPLNFPIQFIGLRNTAAAVGKVEVEGCARAAAAAAAGERRAPPPPPSPLLPPPPWPGQKHRYQYRYSRLI